MGTNPGTKCTCVTQTVRSMCSLKNKLACHFLFAMVGGWIESALTDLWVMAAFYSLNP